MIEEAFGVASSIQTIKTGLMPPPIFEEEELDASIINNNAKLVVEIALDQHNDDGSKKLTPVVYLNPYNDEIDRVPSR